MGDQGLEANETPREKARVSSLGSEKSAWSSGRFSLFPPPPPASILGRPLERLLRKNTGFLPSFFLLQKWVSRETKKRKSNKQQQQQQQKKAPSPPLHPPLIFFVGCSCESVSFCYPAPAPPPGPCPTLRVALKVNHLVMIFFIACVWRCVTIKKGSRQED